MTASSGLQRRNISSKYVGSLCTVAEVLKRIPNYNKLSLAMKQLIKQIHKCANKEIMSNIWSNVQKYAKKINK